MLTPALFSRWLLAAVASAAGLCGRAESRAAGPTLANPQYELRLAPDQGIDLAVAGVPVQRLLPEFTVMYSERNPGLGMNHIARFNGDSPRPFPSLPWYAQRWAFYADEADHPARDYETLGATGEVSLSVNSAGQRYFHYRNAAGQESSSRETLAFKGTPDPYLAGRKFLLRATAATWSGRAISWRFADQPDFSLSAEVVLPAEGGDPQVRYELQVRKSGYYSVAFTGAPWIEAAQLLTVPQETLQTGRSRGNYLITEGHMAIPRVHLATKQMNCVLATDPAESPFRLVEDSKAVWTYELSQESNSRFGLMAEEARGRVRPVVFSPIMGGHESRMEAGARYHFAVRYVLRPGDWKDVYRYVAKQIYAFRDMRDNSGPGPLYHTLENLMDYLSDRDTGNYSMWHAEQKYYNYWSDQSGIFKPFSPLFALSAAIVTDDEEFYLTRARPIVEFALSRRKNVFAPYDVAATGMVSKLEAPLGGPYLSTGALVSLNGMFQNRTYSLRHYAEARGVENGGMMDLLALYHATGKKEYLEKAESKADRFKGAGYLDLIELYEETGAEKYLKAAVDGAYRYISVLNLFPVVPDTLVKVDIGGVAPVHGHAYQRHEDWGFAPPRPLPVPEQTVPAWRVALTGTELSAYRGGYWLNNHGQLMRLATYAHDDFLRDLQRWAMVGRFANYAGDFRSNRYSLVAELPTAPLHEIYDTDFSTFNPGHANEWVGAVIDFMVSDLFNRSNGQIDFPSRGMYESSFPVKVYGDRPGRFYDENQVQLWLPRHLLEADNRQVDYAAGHGNGKFYAAFWNQSFRTEQVSVKLNPDLVDCAGSHRARLWVDNRDQGMIEIVDNRIRFEIAPKGIVAYAIEGVKTKLGLQGKLADPDAITLGKDSLVVEDAPFGQVTAMLLSPGKGLTSSFVYTDAPAAKVISAKLRYRQGNGPWREQSDAIFPYEFSTEIDESKGRFECVLEVETSDQRIQRSRSISLGW